MSLIRFHATIRFWISPRWLSTSTTISSMHRFIQPLASESVVDESDREDTDCVSGRRLNCLAAWVKLRPLTRSVSQTTRRCVPLAYASGWIWPDFVSSTLSSGCISTFLGETFGLRLCLRSRLHRLGFSVRCGPLHPLSQGWSRPGTVGWAVITYSKEQPMFSISSSVPLSLFPDSP